MATKFFCDRCGANYTNNEYIREINLPIWNQHQYDLGKLSTKSIDFCSSCIRDLNEFIRPIPKQV